eukprot:595622-Amphidinium_carterae.1
MQPQCAAEFPEIDASLCQFYRTEYHELLSLQFRPWDVRSFFAVRGAGDSLLNLLSTGLSFQEVFPLGNDAATSACDPLQNLR